MEGLEVGGLLDQVEGEMKWNMPPVAMLGSKLRWMYYWAEVPYSVAPVLYERWRRILEEIEYPPTKSWFAGDLSLNRSFLTYDGFLTSCEQETICGHSVTS